MGDDGIGVTPQVHPAGQDTPSDRDQQPAVGAEPRDELIRHRRDDGGIDGRKREPNGPSGVADRDPAVNQLLSQPCADLPRITALAQDRKNMIAHT
jgi:hypothetical protein